MEKIKAFADSLYGLAPILHLISAFGSLISAAFVGIITMYVVTADGRKSAPEPAEDPYSQFDIVREPVRVFVTNEPARPPHLNQVLNVRVKGWDAGDLPVSVSKELDVNLARVEAEVPVRLEGTRVPVSVKEWTASNTVPVSLSDLNGRGHLPVSVRDWEVAQDIDVHVSNVLPVPVRPDR